MTADLKFDQDHDLPPIRAVETMVTPQRPLTPRERVAIAICLSGIGGWGGGCVCARDGRVPHARVPRCNECLRAADCVRNLGLP